MQELPKNGTCDYGLLVDGDLIAVGPKANIAAFVDQNKRNRHIEMVQVTYRKGTYVVRDKRT